VWKGYVSMGFCHIIQLRLKIMLCSFIKDYILSEALGDLEWIIKFFSSIDEEEKYWLEQDFEEEEV
jgi:hypothetical protein